MCLIKLKMCVLNYHVRLTVWLSGSDYAEYTREADLQKTKPWKQERFIQKEMNFVLGKNGGHTLSNTWGRTIVVVRQAGK